MTPRLPIRLLALLMLALRAAAADAPLRLPAADAARGWEPVGAEQRFDPAGLFNHIDGGAELFLELGFRQLQLQKYRCGEAELAVEAYRMGEPDAALAVFLLKCSPETPWPGFPFRSSGDRYQLSALRGDLFLQVNNFDGGASAMPAMAALAEAVLQQRKDAPPPRLFELLPEADRLAGTMTLIRGPFSLQAVYTFGDGDVLELGGRHFAAAADYRDAAGRTLTRLVALYPDEETAAAVLERLPSRFDRYIVLLDPGPELRFRDFQGRFGRVRRSGTRLEFDLKMAENPT